MNEKEMSRYKKRPEFFEFNLLRKELLAKKIGAFLWVVALAIVAFAIIGCLGWLPSVTASKIGVVLNATELASQDLTQREALLLIKDQQGTHTATVYLGALVLLIVWSLLLGFLSEYTKLEEEFKKKFCR